jgi:surfactin synthase thioesterase subunit
MPAPLGWVRQFHRPAVARPPLLVCPHAGTGASAYRAFSQVLAERFDVVVFQYPGRQDRVREPAAATLTELATGALDDFLRSDHHRGQPLTVFGHSMGAMVAFELVRAAEAAAVPVRLLGVSAAHAPGRVAELPPHPSEDQQILEHLAALQGTGAEVLASSAVMRMALPVVKADYRAFDAYHCPAQATVRAPIAVLGGAEDPFVGVRELYRWADHSEQEVDVTVFDGGHFYLSDHIADIAELLASKPVGHR